MTKVVLLDCPLEYKKGESNVPAKNVFHKPTLCFSPLIGSS